MLSHRLCVRAPEVPRPEFLVRTDARHPDAAVSRHLDPAIYPVPQPRLGRYFSSPGGAEVPGGGRLLYLPARAVLPLDPARARRGRHDRRVRAVAHLLDHHSAAVAAGVGYRRHFYL